ncbi:MAG: 30S ribosomal protein S6, partial [Chloroflexi bacterium]|nr:30S ribosomal protein S6 [Chloroflexota bacterium]
MRNYELMMVVPPHLDEESLGITLDRVKRYIDERGGTVVQQQRWGRVRRLAYPIRSYTEGSYVLTHFQIEPQHTRELEASLIVSEDVLRHLLVKVDGFPEPAVAKAPAASPAKEAPDTTGPESPPVGEVTIPETPVTEPEAVSAIDAPVATAEAEAATVEQGTQGQTTTIEDEVQEPTQEQATTVEDQVEQYTDVVSEEA